MNIGIVDTGCANSISISKMIQKIGHTPEIICESQKLINFKKIILPGVGSFDEAIKNLRKKKIDQALIKNVTRKEVKILGICLGMQLLCENSNEGVEAGLGIINATVKKFEFSDFQSLKVPHMGWNTVQPINHSSLLPEDGYEKRFYFAHSYYVLPSNPKIVSGIADYGGSFCAAFQQDNVFGVQFHPEKSHRFGLALIKRFLDLY